MINRRKLLSSAASLGLVATGLPLVTQAHAQSVSLDKLLEPGEAKEMALGAEDAPVTIVEYASMTCPHCRAFHETTYPVMKSEYIDTGKVRFIFREFPLDNVAMGVSLLTRCAPEDKYFDVLSLFFETQRQWTQTENIVGELFNVAKQVGFSQAEFEECLTNQELLNRINSVKQTAAEEFGVQSTPTFFINGEMVRGAMTVEQMREEIDRRL